MPHALRRTILSVAIDSTGILTIRAKRIVTNNHAAAIIAISDAVGAADELVVFNVDIVPPAGVAAPHRVGSRPRGCASVFDYDEPGVPGAIERIVREDHSARGGNANRSEEHTSELQSRLH